MFTIIAVFPDYPFCLKNDTPIQYFDNTLKRLVDWDFILANTYRKRVSNKKIFLYNLNIVLLSTPRLDYVNDIISSLTNVLHCVFVDQKSKERRKKKEERRKKEKKKKERR